MNMKHRSSVALAVAMLGSIAAGAAHAQEFDWKKYQGTTITFLANNNPVANALLKYKDDFERQTGITLKVDSYQEQQMRQRLVTVMNSRSDEVDLFMSLSSREGLQFSKSGWYADLTPYTKTLAAKEYDFADLSPGLVKDITFDGKVMGIPLNIEGPVLYLRKDLLQKCGVAVPKSLGDLEGAAAKLKSCDANVTPFVSRGLKAALPFTFSVFLHNMGGTYMKGGKSQLCSKEGQAAIDLYAKLLRDYGPPGVINYNFYQISSLYKEGRAAMAFESSNELRNVMDGGARLNDTAIVVLPAGPGGSHPTVIGWSMSVSAYSKKKEAAWYFVQWASSKATQEKLALEGIASPRASVANGTEFKAWMDQQPVRKEWVAAVTELGKTGTSEVGYPIVGNPASRDFIGQAVDDVLLGQKKTPESCVEADKQLDALIAKD